MGNGGLFQRQGLLNDVGLLKERWNQEDSNHVLISTGGNTDGVVYTVTAGKTLYIKAVILTTNATAGNQSLVIIKDAAAIKGSFIAAFDSIPTVPTNLDVPMSFTTNVNLDYTGATTRLVLIGWEE